MKIFLGFSLLLIAFFGQAQEKLDTARNGDTVKDHSGHEWKVVAIMDQPVTGKRIVIIENSKKERKTILNSSLAVTKRAPRKKK